MADEPTPGEVYRRQVEHEQRTDRVHGELDNRITAVARDAVSQVAYQADQRARDAEIGVLREDIKELKDKPGMTLGRWMAVLGVVAAFAGVIVAAYAASKGAS